MDKLQPVIKHRFWILAGLIVPLAIYGYYSANSQLKAATESRESQLESVLSSVDSGNKPNEDYAEKLEAINERYETWVNETLVDLWKRQQERMTWPSQVQGKIPQEFMGDIPRDALVIYEGLYGLLIRDLEQRVQPVEPLETRTTQPGSMRRQPVSEAPNQKVILATNVPTAILDRLTITSDQMWNAQIDIWLTRLLLDAVVRLNEDKDTVTEANLRRIDVLELMGGTGTPQTGGSAPGMMSSAPGGMPADVAAQLGLLDPSSSGPAPLAIPTQTAFDPAQEFGPDSDQAASTGPPTSAQMAMMTTAAPAMRYINESDTAPYLERGFYMSVIILQDQIPNFIEELVNSPWPVRVERFHVGVNPYRTEPSPIQPIGPSSLGRGFGGMDQSAMPFGGPGSSGPRPGRGFRGMSSNPFEGFGRGGQSRRTGQNLPPYATAALNHPDLVQLDLCGVITMYKQPTEALQALADAQPSGVPGDATESPIGEFPIEEVTPADPATLTEEASAEQITTEEATDAAPATAVEAEEESTLETPEATTEPAP